MLDPSPLILYSTVGCHLCDEARELVLRWGAESRLRLQEVDVADDPDLLEHYGIRIPVLRRTDTGAELGWPFDASDVEDFLSRSST